MNFNWDKKVKDIGIDSESKTFFIAEAGINHNGNIELAKKLIDVAKDSGADAVKFQKRTINRILTKEGLNKEYNNKNSYGKTYGEHKKFLELSFEQFSELKDYSDKKGILMTASGWDEESVDFLDSIGVPFFKMASADLTNFPLLEHTAKKDKPMIISTGMSDFDTVNKAYELVSKYNNKICILQCTSSYPTKIEDINLNVIKDYKIEFPEAIIGYSGHEEGIGVSIGACAIGAKVIERHFTLDKTMKGGDHCASLDPKELKFLIKNIRDVEKAMGSFVKMKLDSEEKCFIKLSKSLVSTRKLKEGEIIKREDLTTKGPGTGISPMRMDEIIGQKCLRDIEGDIVLMDEYFDL